MLTFINDLITKLNTQVLYKMDDSGTGQLIELKDLGKANKTLVVSINMLP